MNWDEIKKIVTDNQNGNDWDAAYILKFKNSDTTVYYSNKGENLMQTEAYVVLDILERGSVPLEEIAVYRKEDDRDCLDDLSYYLKRTLPAINRENLDAKVLGLSKERKVIHRKLRQNLSPEMLEKYC